MKAWTNVLTKPTSDPSARAASSSVDAEHRAALRIEHVVARVAEHGAEDRRQLHLREQPVDQQLIVGGDLLVEELRVIEGVAAGAR